MTGHFGCKIEFGRTPNRGLWEVMVYEGCGL